MVILMYHSITRERPITRFEIEVDRFREQVRWLQRNAWQAKALHEVLGGGDAIAERAVVLTFDDGYADNYTNALPVLLEHGFTATVFLVTGHMGGTNEWEADTMPAKALLTWAQVAEMADAGIEFGSHTCSHLDLRHAGVDEIERELLQSRQQICARLSTEVQSFAYPYGYTHERAPELLRCAGYRYGLLAGTYGSNARNTDPYALHRIPAWGSDSLAQFAAKVKGWYWWRYYTIRAAQEARWALRHVAGRTSVGD